ncbi:MAG TPA: ATP-dependent DNA helicase RecG [Candidatus Competibacteraceae bacterium]|nr:ATP-dependent DNA helicase RecG [Candidatus Competibacteraceae bacterium]
MTTPTLEHLSLTELKGVGPRQAARLARLNLLTVGDLLFHLPLRYQDRTQITPIGALQPGQDAVVEGEVVLADVVQGRRRALLCRLMDGSGGQLTLRFFHFSAAQQNLLGRGARLRCFGEVRLGPTGLEMVHPECRRLNSPYPPPPEEHLTPIYPTTEGLSQYLLRAAVAQALDKLEENPEALVECLPRALLERLGFPPLHDALRLIHRPPPSQDPLPLERQEHPAQRRLAFEELLAHQLGLRRLRARLKSSRAVALAAAGSLRRRFLAGLPYALTAAQRRVLAEIDADLDQPRPMLRLVQGDVGSGKTVVAALACLRAVEAGRQAALMAPTELLAEQHYRNLRGWLEPLEVEVAWLAGKLKGKPREAMREALREGRAPIAVGTHALFQEDVSFADLALVVIDEQHRFGVHQRLALREKGRNGAFVPHQLVMTATPIPRTLAMSVYADLDTSVIDQLPPGRTPVKTVVIGEQRREEVMERVRAACRQGRQAYWVCTLIEESEVLEAQAAADTAARLAEALPELRVGLVHGRLKAAEKEGVMAAFKAGEVDLLVATTVIEVGVDVPNASLMIIENAERLGLAQLHQLRGRVGRGSVESSCVLMYRPPLSQQARARLEVLRNSHDGFAIARRDLELRGPGEVLGTRQTGELQLKVADLLRDDDLLPAVRKAADWLLREQPERAAVLTRRWLREGDRYGQV